MKNMAKISKRIRFLFDKIFRCNPECFIFWGFLISFFLFYFYPTFLVSQKHMRTPDILPYMVPIGTDFGYVMNYIHSWFVLHNTPYVGLNLYPPLNVLFFLPFYLLPTSLAYRLFTVCNLCLYLLPFLLFIRLFIGEKSNREIWALFLISGLSSYGFIFELERGQFNLFAMVLAFISIYLFYFKHQSRFIAYFLFVISVQMKVYPLIFIVFFIDNWRLWKSWLPRIAGLVFANILCLFALGPSIFRDFIYAFFKQSANPNIWFVNHSIKSFSFFIEPYINKILFHGVRHISQPITEKLFFAIILVEFGCLTIHAFLFYKEKISPYLFLGCSILALLIPPVSHDYKLSIIIFPAFFLAWNIINRQKSMAINYVLQILSLLLFAFVYSSILFSYAYKPVFLMNSFSAVFILLQITLIFCSFDLITHLKQTRIKSTGTNPAETDFVIPPTSATRSCP